jgi:hypothetical protein
MATLDWTTENVHADIGNRQFDNESQIPPLANHIKIDRLYLLYKDFLTNLLITIIIRITFSS